MGPILEMRKLRPGGEHDLPKVSGQTQLEAQASLNGPEIINPI